VALYRRDVTADLPVGVPADAAVVARDTLGGAVAVAGQLPGQVGAAVLDVARDAFVQGMQVAATISAIIALAVAIMAVTMLRNVRAGSAGGSAGESPDTTGDRAATGERRQPAALDGAAAVSELAA
jgi:DHA2 family multidrug resistance protein-like MFS transporter